MLRARASGVGAHVDVAAYEALGTIPARVCRYLGWEYADHVPLMLAGNAADTLLPIGIFPCADGYVSMMSTPQQLKEMLAVIDDDALTEAFARPDAFSNPETKEVLDTALYPWLFEHTRAEATALAQAAEWPLAGVYSPAEVLEADHFYQRGFWVDCDDPTVGRVSFPDRRTATPKVAGASTDPRRRRRRPTPRTMPSVRVARSAPSPTPPRPADEPPLRGIRVLDFTTVWSGPYLTQLLADLGAEVIRVENPSVFPPTTKGYLPRPSPEMLLGSLLSMYAPPAGGHADRPYNRHALNNSIARNKLSCTLDPRRPEGHELLMRLVEHSDVFVENLKTSTLHQIGIHESQLLERNPQMLVLRIPPAGLTGDWANYTGFGAQFDGLSGFASAHRPPRPARSSRRRRPCTWTPRPAPPARSRCWRRCTTAPRSGAGSSSSSRRSRTCSRRWATCSSRSSWAANRSGSATAIPEIAPQGVYPCRGEERWLAISVRDDADWAAFTRAIGRERPPAGRSLRDERRSVRAPRRARPRHHRMDERSGRHGGLPLPCNAAGVAAGPQFDEEMLAVGPARRRRADGSAR